VLDHLGILNPGGTSATASASFSRGVPSSWPRAQLPRVGAVSLLHPVGSESVQAYWAQRALVSGSSGSGGCHSRWPFPNPASQTLQGFYRSTWLDLVLAGG
jgi:hypothetical protein